MPNWRDSADKTGRGLLNGVSAGSPKTSGHSRKASWKETLNATGSSLLRGVSVKRGESKEQENAPTSPPWGEISPPSQYSSHTWSHSPRPPFSGGSVTMVHNIPCFKLPVPTESSPQPEQPLDITKWGKSKEKKRLNISLPLNLITEPTISPSKPPEPVPKDEKYLRSATAKRTPVEEYPNSNICRHCFQEIQDPLCIHFEKCSCGNIQYSMFGVLAAEENGSHPVDDTFSYCCPPESPKDSRSSFDSPVSDDSNSLRFQVRESLITKIPNDLPCHEAYKPIDRSRSYRQIQAQYARIQSPISPRTTTPEEDAGSVRSDRSSIYSQASVDAGTYFEQYCFPR